MQNHTLCSGMTIVLVLGFIAGASAQGGSKLRYVLDAGQKISVVQTETSQDSDENITTGTKTNSTTTKEINQNWEVTSVSTTGDVSINVKYSSIRMHMSPAPSVDIVVSTTQTIKETNPYLVQLGPQAAPVLEKLESMRKVLADLFIPRMFKIVVSKTGAVKSVAGFDEAMDNYRLQIEKIVPDKAKRAEIDALIEAFFGEDSVNKTFSYTLFTPLPTEDASPGKQWSDATEFSVNSVKIPIKRDFRLTTVSGPAFTLESTTVFSAPSSTEEVEFKIPVGTMKSQIVFDPVKTNVQSQNYDGVLQIEAYSRLTDPSGLILRVHSTFHGSVRMTRLP